MPFCNMSAITVLGSVLVAGVKRVVLLCSVPQSYLILCDPMDCSWPGTSVHGILQAGLLEWVAILFCRGFS